MRVAIVVYDGVLNAEIEAFRSVLGLLRDVEVVTVGTHLGSFSGPGGIQPVDLLVDDAHDVDVAVVPGGIGCERAADDAGLREFLLRMERDARFVAASSTGTVVLASAGLLHGGAASTHWLAADLLRKYGSEADDRRLVVSGNVITCEGQISAVDAAFTLVERLEGPAAVERIRSTLIERGEPHLRDPSLLERAIERTLGRARDLLGALPDGGRPEQTPPPTEPPVTPLSVMVELVDNDELARRMKRSARRRPRH
ncbi:MAG: hypothetical protein HKN41_02375 [Ilumatobacter sp.]|nr:hypothetical protein [Ilumatobacter sp.]